MKKVYITAVVTAALTLLAFSFYHSFWTKKVKTDSLMIGFICENDESTPYTNNFLMAEAALEEMYPGKVTVLTKSNVQESETKEPAEELIRKGCTMLFTNTYSEEFTKMAEENPDVQFCQVSFQNEVNEDVPPNYHTFQGEIYQGRYVSGIAAGLKLRDLIDRHYITPEEALVGYVAAFPTADVISGYTAFFLGVRSVAPEALMRVKYTNNWSSYSLEKDATKDLIDKGCIVLSQHTDTIGPAVACEEAAAGKQVFFVGYNQSMLDVAPTTALISTRINWIPYITQAAGAVLEGEPIEKYVEGKVHGTTDMGAGFEREWVEMVDLNTHIAVQDTDKKLAEAIAALEKGSLQVFKGDYTGTDPVNPADTIDLRDGYIENEFSSAPSFHYVLDDVITIDGEE